MPCLITALTRSAIKKTTRKNKQKISKTKISRQKLNIQIFKHIVTTSKCNRIKILITQIYLFDGNFSLMRLGNKSTKGKKIERNSKINQKFLS